MDKHIFKSYNKTLLLVPYGISSEVQKRYSMMCRQDKTLNEICLEISERYAKNF